MIYWLKIMFSVDECVLGYSLLILSYSNKLTVKPICVINKQVISWLNLTMLLHALKDN